MVCPLISKENTLDLSDTARQVKVKKEDIAIVGGTVMGGLY